MVLCTGASDLVMGLMTWYCDCPRDTGFETIVGSWTITIDINAKPRLTQGTNITGCTKICL
jgi:hypothetical protein